MIFRPGMIVEVSDNGWTYPTYKEIPEHYNLRNWKPGTTPSENKKYKVLHYLSSETQFGRSGEKVLIECLESPHYQFIMGVGGVKIVQSEEFKEDPKLIEKNKADKPHIFFDVNSLG